MPPEPLLGCTGRGHVMRSARGIVHSVGAALARKPTRLLVEPEPESRTGTLIASVGRVAPLSSAAFVEAFHVVILSSKILASVSAEKFRAVTPGTLITIASGA